MDLTPIFTDALKESLNIILIIFVLMVVIEFIILKYKHRITKLISKKNFLSYIIASIMGSIPGCIGTFAMDTLYMTGLVGFGGLMATMIATSGDEAFLILSMMADGKIPVLTVITLLGSLFILGIIGGYIADKLKDRYKWKTHNKCKIVHHKDEFHIKHFFQKHIYQHIIKKHLWQIFLWLFAALFVIGLISQNTSIETMFAGSGVIVIFIIAALLGLLPISGPNVVLIVMFAQGIIPFSIVLVNSIIQDGHGLLPIIGFSLEDAVKIKIFNFIFGVIIAGIVLLAGF